MCIYIFGYLVDFFQNISMLQMFMNGLKLD